MEKVKLRLYQLTLILSLISLALALLSSGKQREFFYIAIYTSIIGLACEYKKITVRPFSIALPVLLIGVTNLIWYMVYEYHSEGLNAYNDYLSASKKLILASILVFYLDRFKFHINKYSFQKLFLYFALTGVAMVLKEYPKTAVNVVGYTDSTGSRSLNMNLSQQRADGVASALITQGVAANRIRTTGAGPDNPIASNSTAEGKAQNRRVEITLSPLQ